MLLYNLGGYYQAAGRYDEAVTALEEVAAEVLPADMGYAWSNMSFQEKKASGTAAVVFAFSLLFVFLILAAQYESWSLPFSILLGTPFAIFGALFFLWVASVSLFLGISWLAVMDGIGGFVLNAWRQAVTLVTGFSERRKAEKMKQERQEVVKKAKARKRETPPPVIEKKEPEIRTSVRVEKEKQMKLLDPEPNTELPPQVQLPSIG